MKVPFFSLQRQWNKHKDDFLPAVHDVLESQAYIGGHFVQNFEEAFAHYVQSSHAISCNSGTDGLWLALKALGIQQEALVLTTPFTFIASSSEIIAHKAHPVFIDIEEDTFNIDPYKVALWLEENALMKNGSALHKETGNPISGIIAVNIFGQCSNYEALHEIATRWNLWIIEDAAQSIGATHHDKPSGTLATITSFSFYPTKNLGGIGDGGLNTTKNTVLAETMRRLRNHGRASHYLYQHYGINSRLDALQAAYLHKKLDILQELTKRRQEIAALYYQLLADVPFIQLPVTRHGTHVFHQFCIRVLGATMRDALVQHLETHGVGTRIFYPESLDTIPFLIEDKRFATICPLSRAATTTILALPIWPELTNEEVHYVTAMIKSFAVTTQINPAYTATTSNALR